MALEIARKLTPEEEELAAKREELARLEAELADRELALASLKAELAAFEGEYLRRVGVLYAELDEWYARIAELDAERDGTPEARSKAAEARSQADDAHSAAHGEAAAVQPFVPSPELRSLYREAAKRVHPDTATDEADRARRERLMKEVNAAYAAGDEAALRRILADLDTSPAEVQGSGVGAELVRVLRQLKQLRNRIAAIDFEMAGIFEADLAKLKAQAELAAAQGRSLFAEMETSVHGRLKAVQQQFEKMSKRVGK